MTQISSALQDIDTWADEGSGRAGAADDGDDRDRRRPLSRSRIGHRAADAG
jgi:hypothetical protein